MPFEVGGSGPTVGLELSRSLSEHYPSRCVSPRGICPVARAKMQELIGAVVAEEKTITDAKAEIAAAGEIACAEGVFFHRTGSHDQVVVGCGDPSQAAVIPKLPDL